MFFYFGSLLLVLFVVVFVVLGVRDLLDKDALLVLESLLVKVDPLLLPLAYEGCRPFNLSVLEDFNLKKSTTKS